MDNLYYFDIIPTPPKLEFQSSYPVRMARIRALFFSFWGQKSRCFRLFRIVRRNLGAILGSSLRLSKKRNIFYKICLNIYIQLLAASNLLRLLCRQRHRLSIFAHEILAIVVVSFYEQGRQHFCCRPLID